MGIHDNNQPNNAMKDAMQDAQARAPQFDANAAGERQETRLRGMAMLNSLIARPMSRTGVGEQLSAYTEALREAVKKQLNDDAQLYTWTPVDRSSYELPANVIVASTLVRHNGGSTILAYSLVLEAAEGFPSRFMQVGANEYELPTTASDAYDGRTIEAVNSILRNHYAKQGGDNAQLDIVTFNILPVEVLPTDEKRMARLASLIVNTIDGAAKELPGLQEARFSAQLIAGPKNAPTGVGLSGRMDFNPAPKETVTGLPIRNDITVSTKLVMPSANHNGAPTSANVLTQIGGYIDLTYVEPEMVQIPGGFGGMVKSTNAYQARFVITNTDVEINAVTNELALLALASSYMLNTNNAWLSYFKKRHGVENDTRDVGAIGYEIPVDNEGTLAKIDTSASDFNLHQFVSRYFRPGLMFSIDVEQGGDDSWVWANLEYAAAGDPAAIQDFIDVADNLTNNHFSPLWAKVPAEHRVIAQHSGNVLTLGYFNYGAGKEDNRKLDYLAMLNLFGASDLRAVVDYGNTFDAGQGDPAIRLGERTRQQRNIMQDNVHFKKSAHRYDLNPIVLETLVVALSQAGLNIVPETVFGEFNQTQRGTIDSAFVARPSAAPIFASAPRQAGTGNFAASIMRPSTNSRFG